MYTSFNGPRDVHVENEYEYQPCSENTVLSIVGSE